MPRLVVNDEDELLQEMPETWGDLLAVLEQTAARRGEVVTAVRFDGVDEPTFTGAAAAGRALAGTDTIEVETAGLHELIDQALAQGSLAVGVLSTAATQTGEAFRGADLAGANQRLAELSEGIRSLLSVLGTGATAVGVDLTRMEWDGRPVAARMRELSGQLEAIVEAQESRDWLTVADILQYDFEPALTGWQPIFEALRSAIPA